MTKQKKYKQRVRARMEKTGEKFTAADRQLSTKKSARPPHSSRSKEGCLHLKGLPLESVRSLLSSEIVVPALIPTLELDAEYNIVGDECLSAVIANPQIWKILLTHPVEPRLEIYNPMFSSSEHGEWWLPDADDFGEAFFGLWTHSKYWIGAHTELFQREDWPEQVLALITVKGEVLYRLLPEALCRPSFEPAIEQALRMLPDTSPKITSWTQKTLDSHSLVGPIRTELGLSVLASKKKTPARALMLSPGTWLFLSLDPQFGTLEKHTTPFALNQVTALIDYKIAVYVGDEVPQSGFAVAYDTHVEVFKFEISNRTVVPTHEHLIRDFSNRHGPSDIIVETFRTSYLADAFALIEKDDERVSLILCHPQMAQHLKDLNTVETFMDIRTDVDRFREEFFRLYGNFAEGCEYIGDIWGANVFTQSTCLPRQIQVIGEYGGECGLVFDQLNEIPTRETRREKMLGPALQATPFMEAEEISMTGDPEKRTMRSIFTLQWEKKRFAAVMSKRRWDLLHTDPSLQKGITDADNPAGKHELGTDVPGSLFMYRVLIREDWPDDQVLLIRGEGPLRLRWHSPDGSQEPTRS